MLQRIYLENDRKIANRTILLKGQKELLDEYPFNDDGVLKDSFIIEDRIHPSEVTENTGDVRKQVERYQE